MEYKIFCFADDFFICAKSLQRAIRYVRRELREEWAFSDFKKTDLEKIKVHIRVVDGSLEDYLYCQNPNIEEYGEVLECVDGVLGNYVWDGFDWYERIPLKEYLFERLKEFHNREFQICEEGWRIGLVPVK